MPVETWAYCPACERCFYCERGGDEPGAAGPVCAEPPAEVQQQEVSERG